MDRHQVVLPLPEHRIQPGATISVCAPGVRGTRRVLLPPDVRPGSSVLVEPSRPGEPPLEVLLVLREP